MHIREERKEFQQSNEIPLQAVNVDSMEDLQQQQQHSSTSPPSKHQKQRNKSLECDSRMDAKVSKVSNNLVSNLIEGQQEFVINASDYNDVKQSSVLQSKSNYSSLVNEGALPELELSQNGPRFAQNALVRHDLLLYSNLTPNQALVGGPAPVIAEITPRGEVSLKTQQPRRDSKLGEQR